MKSVEERKAVGIFDEVRDLGPPDLFDLLEQCAGFLPEHIRYRLRRVIQTAGRDEDPLQRVLEVVRAQWEGLRSLEPISIAVVGPARTGKSTLVAAIGRGDLERVSPLFTIDDQQNLSEYLGYGRGETVPPSADSDLTLVTLDASYEITADTIEMVDRIKAVRKPLIIVLNKIDLVGDGRRRARQAKKLLKVPVIPVSGKDPDSVEKLLKGIVSACPKAVYPLAQRIPYFRQTISESIITQAAMGAGLVGAIPIPVGHLLPISAIQTAMVLKLARAHGFRVGRGRARELLPIFAAGVLVREGVDRLKRSLPQHERLISIAVGGLWTYLIGRVALQYFEHWTLEDSFVVPSTEEEP